MLSYAVVRAQRGWGEKERQGAEERNNSPRDQKTEGRKLEGEASGGHSASLSSDSEDESVDARQSKGQTTVLHTAARLDNAADVNKSSDTCMHTYGCTTTHTHTHTHTHHTHHTST